MKKKHLLLMALVFVSAVVVAGVQSIPFKSVQEVQQVSTENDPPADYEEISLQNIPFCKWNGWDADASVLDLATCEWIVGESTEMPYGDPLVVNYADLSQFSKLVVTITDGVPRFLFNRDVEEGQWNEDEAESHLIDNTKEGWSSKYFSIDNNVYTVDLAALVADKGYAHLHAIKGANWEEVMIESMVLIMEKGESPVNLNDWTSINHDGSSSSSYTWLLNNTETAMLRFNWSVSSESGYDFLRIVLDGNMIVEASGENSGTYETFIDGGIHTMVGTYSKDGGTDHGSDQAIVKDISFGTIDETIAQKIAHVQEVAAANSHINSALLAEVNAYSAQISAGNYDKANGNAVMAQLDDYATRLAYTHLDISVPVPGAMGDSILSKVENFVDVQSLRLTGKLNSDDIATLKNRLTSVVELDLAGLDWKNIPNEQFHYKSGLQYVILPANVETIGNSAFSECRNMKPLVFPATLQSIGEWAFYQTYSIGDVVLPEGLTSMGNYAFYESGLTSVTFPSTLNTINYECFYNCDNLKEINFNGQTTIDQYAFIDCNGLINVKFPETLTFIGQNAFSYCHGLKEIEFNEGLTQIEDNAFYDCDGLTEVTLPSTLIRADQSPFDYCDNLMKVTCLSIEPPYMTDQIPYGVSMSGRELYVPALSLSVYKQTSGWDRFETIKPIDSYPKNIVITGDYKLNWPDSLSFDYKPNVYLNSWGNERYGSLTVNGNSTLSAGQFSIQYDPNIARNNTYRDAWGTYTHNRYAYTSLVNNANVRADNITLDYWLRANSWEFVSVPFDVKVGDIRQVFEGTPFVIRKYDGEKRAAGLTGQTWVDMSADSILQAGKGYIWRSASTESNRNYTGFYLDALQTANKNNIFVNDNVEVPLTYYESEFAHNRSWNLIGNPYPCFYDIRAMQTSAPITVWDTYQQNYRAYSPQDDAYILNPGQAFFVQRPVDEESITFLKEGRQTNLTVRDVTYNRAAARAGSTVERNVFNVVLSNGEKSDRTRFVINGSAKMDYESARDASKFMALEYPVMQLYTLNGDVRYSINERPLDEGVIKLGMQIVDEGMYTISLDTKVENEVYLIDHLTDSEVRLDGNSYGFHSEIGTFESRFSIRLGSSDTTGIKAVENAAVTNAVYYDLNGRRISEPSKGVYVKDGKKTIIK